MPNTTTFATLPPYINIEKTNSFIKVIVVQIGYLNSEVVDERHFGVNDSEKIREFKESYSVGDYYCFQVKIKSEDVE